MERVTEPELMVDDDQAQAYSDADFTESHQGAVTRFAAAFPEFRGGRMLDLACGPADVTIRFARAYPATAIVGVEGSPAMLALGVRRVAREGLDGQITFAHLVLPDPGLATLGTFDAVICTGSMHHFHDPAVLWNAIHVAASPGASVFVQDLMRPDSAAVARALVDEHAAGEPEVLRTDYFNSLRAAFTPAEVREQLMAAGFTTLAVAPVTDRHLVVSGHAP
ncbi:MAG: class I SAM-dependent methyltransferase [Acidimicrobiia bacterium]